MTDCRDAAGTPMDSTVGRGEAMGVPAASLRHVSLSRLYDPVAADELGDFEASWLSRFH